MSYNYGNSGNKLNFVNDAIIGNQDMGDFRNLNTTNDDYEYWPNGGLKTDKNKGISLIEYDTYLNKVKKVNWADGRWITFTYNGASELIQRKNSTGDIWDYANGIIYKNNVAYQIPTPEGRIVNNAGSWAYEYELPNSERNIRRFFKDKKKNSKQT
ncbi:hypothetical protein [Lacihabitans lacunae]|uniref:RHS repeat-associated core domain-containing protein n=1 Tax=Lacihabitans lacunae TaxID=1028214 RepID=A0ABV7Z197_9BACT